MAICDVYPLSRNAYFYVLPETDAEFGTQILPTAAMYIASDAVAPLACTMGFEQERNFTEAAQGTRARVKDRLITGKQSASWTMETYLDVSDTTLKGPDIHRLLKAALGASDGTDGGAPARDKRYLPAATGNCLPTMNIVRTVPDSFSETVYGSAVESFSISMSSGDPVKLSFSGMAYNHILTGVATASAADYSGMTIADDVTCDPTINVYQVQPRTSVYGSSDIVNDNAASLWSWKDKEGSAGGAAPGYTQAQFNKVSIYDTEDTGRFRNQTVNQVGPDGTTGTPDLRMVPWFPEGGSSFGTPKPISSTQGTVSITPLSSTDGARAATDAITSAPITSLELTLTNNIKAIDDEAFTDSSFSGFIPGFRDVTGTISMRLKTDVQGILLHRRELFRRCAVQIILGDSAANHVQIDMAFVEFDTSSIETSGQDEMTVSMPFKSLVADTTAAEVVKDLIIEWK